MSAFKPFVTPSDLPKIGDGFERATLDLKATYDLAKQACMAIDVAAFANHIGGTLLIGASETDGRVGAYVPVPEAENNARKDAFSKAVAGRCRPAPHVDLVPIAYGTGWVLAVNVWPQVNGPVGVRVCDVEALAENYKARHVASGVPETEATARAKTEAKRDAGGYAGDSWVFPIRSGSDAFYVTPENLPMYMLPHVRRTALLLRKIPPGATVQCVVADIEKRPRVLDSVDEEANVVKMHAPGDPAAPHWVPLDGIASVFETESDGWWLLFEKKNHFYRR